MRFFKRNISLRFGLSTSFVSLVLLTALLVGFVSLRNMQNNMRRELRCRIHDYVSAGVLLIDPVMHAKLKTSSDENSPEYKIIRQKLQQLRDQGLGVKYVYTMRRDSQGVLTFVVDAENDPEEISHIGDVYDTPTETMTAIFDYNGGALVEKEPSKDDWGVWLSGFAAIRGADGKIEAILGADVSAESIRSNERRAALEILFYVLLVTLFAVILALYISRKVTQPLSVLSAGMTRVRKFELDFQESNPTHFHEIIAMNEAFASMRAGLKSFGRYVPAELVRSLLAVNSEAKLGGEKKELTVFFADIKDFSGMAERLEPEVLARLLERYTSIVSREIQNYSGTVDKYIGDAVMAIWGAPVEVAEHSLQACRCALACRRGLAALNEVLTAEGVDAIEARIGINTGEVIVGNFGYEERMNYTVLGDHVNLASRLEGLGKIYGTDILISGFVEEKIRHEMLCRLVDYVAVKGRRTAVKVYHIVGRLDECGDFEKQACADYAGIFELYQNGNFTEALAGLNKFCAGRPNDKTAAVLRERCRGFTVKSPKDGWDGVTMLTEK